MEEGSSTTRTSWLVRKKRLSLAGATVVVVVKVVVAVSAGAEI